PFEDSRSREYPTPPQKEPYGSAMFRKAAEGLGYHPYPQPSCNLSEPYTNPEGMQLNTCSFCGYCERYGCEHFAKSSAQTTLLPGIGAPNDPATAKGVVGRNYAYQTMSSVSVFYDESVNINPFMRSGACGTVISDFVSDNFDHGPLGFVGGAYVGEVMSHGRPIEFHPTPPGTPPWGSAWKQAVARHYNHTSTLGIHGSSIAVRQNYLD